MKIAIVTDAWHPQINGVVRTLGHTGQHLQNLGHEVLFITPEKFLTYPCPTYPSIRLAVFPKKRVREMLHEFRPQAVHIATEGPLGHAAKALCLSDHVPSPRRITHSFQNISAPDFPYRSSGRMPTCVDTTSCRPHHGRDTVDAAIAGSTRFQEVGDLGERRRYRHLSTWSQVVFVRTEPISMYMGRVAVEKNIEAFLNLDVPGSKYVIGDGPDSRTTSTTIPQRDLCRTKTWSGIDSTPCRRGCVCVSELNRHIWPCSARSDGLWGPCCSVSGDPTGGCRAERQDRRAGSGPAPGSPWRTNTRRSGCVAYARQHSWRHWTERFVSLLEPIKED